MDPPKQQRSSLDSESTIPQPTVLSAPSVASRRPSADRRPRLAFLPGKSKSSRRKRMRLGSHSTDSLPPPTASAFKLPNATCQDSLCIRLIKETLVLFGVANTLPNPSVLRLHKLLANQLLSRLKNANATHIACFGADGVKTAAYVYALQFPWPDRSRSSPRWPASGRCGCTRQPRHPLGIMG